MSQNSSVRIDQSDTTTAVEDLPPLEGVPPFCDCGERVSLRTSRSVTNPGRKYYCCDLAYIRKIYDRHHYFRWFDDAIVQQITRVVREIEEFKKEISDLNGLLEDIVYHLDRQSYADPARKTKLTMMTVLVVCISYVLFVLTTSF